MHSNVTIKNVSWPHFSWTTLYIAVTTAMTGPHYVLLIDGKLKHNTPLVVAYTTADNEQLQAA